ncbi:benzoyl-CoA-dihydrodiol lyase [Paramagnetospirillum kuznetsovii]|uniref:Benzoyl-CoA-dihydrodiol lyase n=1 Tax=Paramagnetospirillum kuznetsovii TaxID=2053833 RepID=A0A364P0Z0_9PROT|nr:2,3-epoxybenzoyl-CoA dihydrolase [Paramagnetospirillum kuznetsovii]RAU23002.1 benzoyl-CoA-dihydrodiol lyase [Paramagnetospirillum kuznetsovii]
MIDFQTSPDRYRHWKLAFDGAVATLTMDVDPTSTLAPGYELKMNSYDLGVDIELYDAVQRLRFEHPEVRTVVMASANPKIFCAGANIKMLGVSSHGHKVNFCKFTNETRNSIEDASDNSKQKYLCAVTGTAAGGGYELALATDYIMMVDDGNTAVSLPEVPLLAVLPGTGGLTRVVDKRKVRRDLADIFCSIEEGVKGKRAVEWRLVDEVIPSSAFKDAVRKRAEAMAATSDRPTNSKGVVLTHPARTISDTAVTYPHLEITFDRDTRTAHITVKGPSAAAPSDLAAIHAQGVDFYPLALARELDDAILHLRANETTVASWVIRSQGDMDLVAGYDAVLQKHAGDWLVREVLLYWKRTCKRLDVTSRTLFALVEPGSCFGGFIAEILFAVDRSYMLDGTFEDSDLPAAKIRLSALNFDGLPMGNGISRIATRFLGEPDSVGKAKDTIGKDLDAAAVAELGLVTATPDDIDWDDEIRLVIEERAAFSPDSLTGMEANLRFAGPETMETKIFGRLTAWQNWIFQRPNAVGENGALKLYGTGKRAAYNQERV